MSELKLPIDICPTSEIVLYPYFFKWTRGYCDLLLRFNHWCNAVRLDFSNPTPFIRSCEFIWHEGYTAFATKEEADTEVFVPNIGHGVQGATSNCLGQYLGKKFFLAGSPKDSCFTSFHMLHTDPTVDQYFVAAST